MGVCAMKTDGLASKSVVIFFYVPPSKYYPENVRSQANTPVFRRLKPSADMDIVLEIQREDCHANAAITFAALSCAISTSGSIICC